MKILITGAKGQLGNDLIKILGADTRFELIPFSKAELDITDENKVNEAVRSVKPNLVIHAAAYTAVDDCESNRKKAFEVNSFGAYYVAKAAKEVGAAMVYISTDFIFNGKKKEPYTVNDAPDPLSIYGKSKLLGERLVQLVLKECYIVRTAWLYGQNGENFVKTMLHLAKKDREFFVVNDQMGSPTYTKDLAIAIKQLIGKKFGLYHISNTGSCSWFTFAQSILSMAGYNPALVKPISTKDYGVVAQRPAFSVLSTASIEKEGIQMRHWQAALQKFLEKEEYEYD
ncbi:dTDP-4-dehydrorhamnose reductase [Lederbergia sp. NSJ-179]|uniref:dTDP-4-dehydrorhamnose reductase n=1 Tax=Lederbergia sp. NSJ-179 TaxID=2931402 RepID=UPI001FD1BCF4|nr:dTDP-4-dehydrorhamnose reductase [Lederbergia sp. NSJ-179]MCJ7841368.1 dTDP-4-dehydrorhamnose reductase [Lederbergia sp. NSJ-179]